MLRLNLQTKLLSRLGGRTYNHVHLYNVRMCVDHFCILFPVHLHLISIPHSVPHSCVPAFTVAHTNPSKMAMTTNTTFITQTVLCEAPYCLPSLCYIHAQQDKSLSFIYNPPKNRLKFSMLAMFTLLLLPKFKLQHLQAKSQKYVH